MYLLYNFLVNISLIIRSYLLLLIINVIIGKEQNTIDELKTKS